AGGVGFEGGGDGGIIAHGDVAVPVHLHRHGAAGAPRAGKSVGSVADGERAVADEVRGGFRAAADKRAEGEIANAGETAGVAIVGGGAGGLEELGAGAEGERAGDDLSRGALGVYHDRSVLKDQVGAVEVSRARL